MPDTQSQLGDLLDHLEQLLAATEEFDPPVREQVFALLDGVDELHRRAIHLLADSLGDALESIRAEQAEIDWLFRAYGVGVDEVEVATQALDEIRPYIHGHGGAVEVLEVDDGVVTVRLSGACSGCTASAETLREGVEQALSTGFPGFAGMQVEEDPEAASHPPPGPTLLQIQPRPA